MKLILIVHEGSVRERERASEYHLESDYESVYIKHLSGKRFASFSGLLSLSLSNSPRHVHKYFI
jgi:hypothetical protein